MSENKKNIIAEYIAKAPINISALEQKAGLPPRTLHNYFNNTNRQIRWDKWWKVLVALCPVVIGAHTYEYDDRDASILISCKAGDEPDMPVKDMGSYDVYYPATYRSLILDDEDFKQWFNL